jgi:pterin-4a-carbinolamine dehydratase
MSGKQMEGDNQRRRALARQARQRGQQPSGAGFTLGASKQLEHLDQSRRDGPPEAGPRKPAADRAGLEPAALPSPAPPSWPLPDPDQDVTAGAPGVTVIKYRDLITDVGRRAGVDFDQARSAAEATVLALAQALDEAGRERLLAAVPNELHNGSSGTVARRRDLAGFLEEVARISRRTPEQARYQAQATLSALVERDRELVESLDLPTDLRDLLEPPPAGGGVVSPTGQTAALTADELRAALADLPYWSGDGRSLTRSIELPPENLDRVLGRLAALRPETGRGPRIGRESPGTAVIVVRTSRVNAVTALDIDLARQVDDAIDEAGAGMAD